MLKQTVTYKDWDDKEVTDTLYFNISKIELMNNLHLQDRIDKLQKMLEGGERQLTPTEITEILDIVKVLMELAYGVRSEDGKRFIKNQQVWEEFQQTNAYDAFLFSLFSEPDKAVEFMLGVMPQDLRQQVQAEMENPGTTASVTQLPTTPTDDGAPEKLEDNRPQWLKEGREPTQKELQNMDRDELVLAMQFKQEKQKESSDG